MSLLGSFGLDHGDADRRHRRTRVRTRALIGTVALLAALTAHIVAGGAWARAAGGPAADEARTSAAAAGEGTAVDPAAVVGRWALSIERDGRQLEPEVRLRLEDGVLRGTWHDPLGEAELREATFDEGVLRADFARETAEGPSVVRLRARIEGDRLSGTVDLLRQVVNVEGTRVSDP